MNGEFEKKIRDLQLDDAKINAITDIIENAGKEFPCLSCTSKDECANFEWHKKWFGTEKNRNLKGSR